jgi:hypothetical protein
MGVLQQNCLKLKKSMSTRLNRSDRQQQSFQADEIDKRKYHECAHLANGVISIGFTKGGTFGGKRGTSCRKED